MAAQDATDQTDLLSTFVLTRILDQDPKQKSANLLGTLRLAGHAEPQEAVLLLEKTHFTASFLDLDRFGGGHLLGRVESLGQNDIYTWLLAWLSNTERERDADAKINVICPATQAHVDKYSTQSKLMVYETPEVYRTKIRPYIESIPQSRIQWVYNILEHKKEVESILYEDPDPKLGFIILPDLKWDQKTLSSLYLQGIVHDRSLRSLRDLKKHHAPLLRNIRDKAALVAQQRFGLGLQPEPESRGMLRCFIHYHPSFYHLHVHILSASFTSHPGAIVGQAHLLEDVIDLLELGVDFEQRTIGYALGERHYLWDVLDAVPIPAPAN